MVGGEQDVEARLVAKGYRDPEMKNGLVEVAGRVSLRSPHLLALPSGALEKWEIWNLDIKNAFLHADGFQRGACLRGPAKWIGIVFGICAPRHVDSIDAPAACR